LVSKIQSESEKGSSTSVASMGWMIVGMGAFRAEAQGAVAIFCFVAFLRVGADFFGGIGTHASGVPALTLVAFEKHARGVRTDEQHARGVRTEAHVSLSLA
jgi:hypothetical protein